jgi:hypothetical protein
MKKLLIPIAFAVLAIPALLAQSAIEGTWKIDTSKVDFSKKPEVDVLQGGMFECKTCVPAIRVKADGTDQAVTGHPYYDTIAVTVVNDHEIKDVRKKNGKIVSTATTTVSADGQTETTTFSDSSATNGGPPVTGKAAATRTAKGPAGSHAVSGSWVAKAIEGISDNAIVWTYKVSGNEVTMTNPTGQSYTAKLDGTDAPMKGDPGTSSVSVKMIGKNTIEETDKRDGKVIGVWKMTVAADGKTAKGTSVDTLENRTSSYAVVKQ